MNRAFSLALLLLLSAALVSCGQDPPMAPQSANDRPTAAVDPESLALDLVAKTGWPAANELSTTPDGAPLPGAGALGMIESVEREVVAGNIVHYSVRVRFGSGPYDVFGLHRVVKEPKPYRPIQTPKSLFALHGTPGHFKVMYLFGSVTSAPDDQSLAVFLAENDVDVWGIDQAYTLVPEGVTDFSFMADWGMQFDVDNLRTGMAIARFARRITGSGNGKMTLMGYSTGFVTGFAALNHETQLPPGQRHIGAFIPVDNFFKTDDPDWIASESAYLQDVAVWLDAGIYANDYGLLFQTFGFLGESDPYGPSPIIPGVTNLQAALLAGAQTGLIFGFPGDLHFFAGIFDGSGFPVDLAYTPVMQYLEWLQGFNNYGANRFEYDFTGIHCDQVELPFDDHLGEISVPVFFLGAGGGWGDLMDYTAALLTGTGDVAVLNVSLQSPKLLDIGHVDIFTAGVAQEEFWQPVLDWMNARTRPGRNGRPGDDISD